MLVSVLFPTALEFIIINVFYFIFNHDKIKRIKYALIQIIVLITVILIAIIVNIYIL